MSKRLGKHRELELIYYCYQYREWLRELAGDCTKERRELLERDVKMIQDCTNEAGGDIAPFLLKAITEPEATYTSLRMRGMPCGKNYFYKRRRIFYTLLDGRKH